jgi:hypothetical protein
VSTEKIESLISEAFERGAAGHSNPLPALGIIQDAVQIGRRRAKSEDVAAAAALIKAAFIRGQESRS